jgi:hypothetical protein
MTFGPPNAMGALDTMIYYKASEQLRSIPIFVQPRPDFYSDRFWRADEIVEINCGPAETARAHLSCL